MSGKLKKNIGFSLLPFAFVFLFEPSLALIDPLPDFIGYAIMCAAIINLADVNPMIMDAFKGFSKAAILSALRLGAFVILNFALDGKEQTVSELLFIFVFALFDAIILIPSYKKLFSGLLNLGIYHDGQAVSYTKRAGGYNASETMYALSVVFVIVKNLFWVLPEFTSLAENDTYEFIGVLRLFSLVIIVPVSVAWLIKVICYFLRVKKDQHFIKELENLYTAKAEASPSFFVMRTSCVGIIAFVVGAALSFDLVFDGANVTPDALFYASLIFGAVVLRKFSKRWKIVLIPTSVGIVASVFCDLARSYFYSRYEPDDVIKSIGAYNSYYFMVSVNVVESVTFLLSLIAVLIVLKDVYLKNTDVASDPCGREASIMKRKFFIGSLITTFSGIISCAGSLFYVFSLPLMQKADGFAMANVLRMGVGILFAFVFWYFAGYVKSCIKQHCKSYLY